MSDANPMLQEAEVQRLLSKAAHYGCAAEIRTVEGGHLRVIVSGQSAPLFDRQGKSWCPRALIQGTGEVNQVSFIWEVGSFVKAPGKDPTKPEGSKPDKEVLDGISRMIDRVEQLKGILRKLNTDIEAAYPGVKLSNSGFGKGKLVLVTRVLEQLQGSSSRNLTQFTAYVAIFLARHFECEDGVVIEIPEAPRSMIR